MTKKAIALTIAAVLLLSVVPPGPAVRADSPAPEIHKIYLLTETNSEGEETVRYEILGSNFNNATVIIDYWQVTPSYQSNFLIRVEKSPEVPENVFWTGKKSIAVENSDGQRSNTVSFDVTVVPYVSGVNKSKVYVDEPLEITGSGFDSGLKELRVAGALYTVGGPGSGAEAIIQGRSRITIEKVKPREVPGVGSVWASWDAGDGTDPGTMKEGAIQAFLTDCITVVQKLTGIEVERLEPNTGPVTGGTIIRMYGAPGQCNFQDNMRVYIGGVPATDVSIITDDAGNTIGLQAKTPPSATAGPKEVVIKDSRETSEYFVEHEFTYLQTGNFLLLQSIEPNQAKETETKEVAITGRNIGTINVEGVTVSGDPTGTYDMVRDEYVLEYSGDYYGDAVDITRKIKLTIGNIATITGVPVIDVEGDVLTAKTQVTTMPQTVDVVMKTVTTVTRDGVELLQRVEEYIMPDAFTYIPAKTQPAINSITPGKGPCDEDIYITIKGERFQVLTVQEEVDGVLEEVTRYPVVIIGDKVIDPNDPDTGHYVHVYDDNGNLLDGKKYTLGTLIRTKIPAVPVVSPGFVHVTVRNPDLGEDTAPYLFEFCDADPEEPPIITGIDPNKGTVDGGTPVTIYGRHFDNDRTSITVTIDGAAAEVVSVKSTGDLIEIITPPGVEGYRTVQVINGDGSMATLEDGYYYTRVTSRPVIDTIAPDYGGAYTQVIIRGRDFRVPDPDSELIHRKLGTRVLLNGVDIDDYTVVDGEIVFAEPDGQRTFVLDEYTIKIIIPPDLPLGPKDVTVLNPDTASHTVPGGFVYKIPASNPAIYDITGDGLAISPDEGSVNGGTIVTIEGEDFREGVRVFFGGVEADYVTVNDSENIIQAATPKYFINTPGADSETVDVTVVNTDGGSCTQKNGFTYKIPGSDPFIRDLEPNWGSTAGGDFVLVWGGDFRRQDTDEDGTYDRLPRVYFGGVEAPTVEWGHHNMLRVETPPYPDEGRVDVTVVNPDAGSYIARNLFEYRRSKPVVTGVVPGKGTRLGGQEITIKGSEFIKADLSSSFDGEQVNRHTPSPQTPWIDLLVVFGDETDSAPIYGGKSELAIGNIRVVYDATQGGANTKLYRIPYSGADEFVSEYNITAGTYHIFIVNGREDLEDDTITDEGIMVEISGGRMTVTRRIAPYARHINDGMVVAYTPPVEYIGTRSLYVINRDGGTAVAEFEYTNPDSKPQIFDISPKREMYGPDGEIGGYVTEGSAEADTYVTIYGRDFRTGVKVFVEDIEAEVISKSNDDDQLIVRVPPAGEGYIGRLLNILVVNQDGGDARSSDMPIPHWFEYKKPASEPVIYSVTPARTSAAGGNRVVIEGNDFRPGLKVFIGGREVSDIEMGQLYYRLITVTTPGGLSPGPCDVQVLNPDFGAATLKGGLTIVSYPKIEYVTDENGSLIDTIPITGGGSIVLKGTGFQPGARVVFGGEVVPINEAPPAGGIPGHDHLDRAVMVIGGAEGSVVEVPDESTLRLVPPAGVEGDVTLLVINPDQGLSQEYRLSYKLPVPGAPEDLDVSLVYDRYVRLEWPAVEDALYYEIYAREGTRGDFRFIASTTRTVYYIIDLDSDTRYYFRVKAINKFGSSEFTSQRSIRTEDTREDDTDGGINEEQRIFVQGSSVTVSIPEDALDKTYYYNIDLGDHSYAGKSKKTINIPLAVIRNGRGTLTVDTGDLLFRFSPSVLNAAPLWSVSASDRDKAYGRLTLDNAEREGERALKYLPARLRAVSGLHSIGLTAAVGKKEERCAAFNGTLYLQVKYRGSLPRGVAESSLALYRFDPSSLEWERVAAAGLDTAADFAHGSITKPGIYAVLGEIK
jgi:hypothetical protein